MPKRKNKTKAAITITFDPPARTRMDKMAEKAWNAIVNSPEFQDELKKKMQPFYDEMVNALLHGSAPTDDTLEAAIKQLADSPEQAAEWMARVERANLQWVGLFTYGDPDRAPPTVE